MAFNIENLKKVRDAIHEESLAGFSMNFWIAPSGNGTVACIGGTAELIMREEGNLIYDVNRGIRGWLGIPYDVGEELFYGWPSATVIKHITKEIALKALDDMIENNNFQGWEAYV